MAYNALAHTLVGFGGFFLLGGWRLFKRRDGVAAAQAGRRPDGNTPLADDGGHRRAHRRRGRFRRERGDDGAHHRDAAHPAAHRRRAEGDQGDAVGRHPDGDRRDGSDRDAGEDRGPRPVHVGHCPHFDAGDDRAHRRVRHRHRLGLQQHVRRRAAGVSADGAGPRAAAGRHRTAADRVVDDRRIQPRRSVVALDRRRVVHGGRGRRHRHATAVQPASCSGAFRWRSSAPCCAGCCSGSEG